MSKINTGRVILAGLVADDLKLAPSSSRHSRVAVLTVKASIVGDLRPSEGRWIKREEQGVRRSADRASMSSNDGKRPL